MTSYVSLLRGINVSGQKKINMKDLKSLYESLGFMKTSTYIQSGNVVFTSSDTTESKLKALIEESLSKRYGFEVPVIILTKNNVLQALNMLPFEDVSPEFHGSQTLFSFLSKNVENNKIEDFNRYLSSTEQLYMNNDVVYLYCPDGYGKTKITTNLLEKKLNVIATTRNWKTMLKINSMLQAIE